MSIIECVPNFSEGRDQAKIDAIAEVVNEVKGVTLISCESDADHNRSVLTMAGSPEGVLEAAFRVYQRALALIDLNQHSGEHPRMGAVDVCPFIPVKDASMDDCVALAGRLGARVGSELNIPVYLYESAATRPERRNLADIRKGQFEKLKDLIGSDETRVPDFGPNAIHHTFGCTAIGARFFLVAYNVNLQGDNVGLAKSIGKAIREKDGGLPGVKAMGFALEEEGKVVPQVSMNLVDYRKTSPAQAFARIEELAGAEGVLVKESELIGVIPREALDLCAAQALKIKGFNPKMILENNLETADDYLVGVGHFLDDLASDTPTPGGGAAAAVIGGIGCALTSMVANLTIGKKKYAAVEDQARAIHARAVELRGRLMAAYREDIEAFDNVMAAFKLPKGTDAEKAARSEAIQQATKGATLTPLACARTALEGLKLAKEIAGIGNANAISDAGVSALALEVAVKAATLNMRINLGSISDEAFRSEHAAIVETIEREASELGAGVRASVLATISGH